MSNVPQDSSSANPYAVFAPDTEARHTNATDGQPILLDGSVGLQQMLRAGRLCVGSQLRRVRPIIMVALLALSIVTVAYGYWFNRQKVALGGSFQAAAAGLFIMATTCRHGSTMLKFDFFVGLRKPERQICTITDTGVRMVFARRTLNDAWSRFCGFSESEDMIILWRGPQYIPLPREFAASEGEWQRLRELLYARLLVRRS